MKILSLSSVYPNPKEPGLGLFVRSRLEQVARLAEVQVIAPVPVLDYAKVPSVPGPQSPILSPTLVFHPRWIYPPGGTPVNVICQFLRLLPLVSSIRQSFPFDLIDAHFGYPEGATAALLASVFRVPYTITLRGSESMFAASPTRRKVLRWAMRRADHIIAVSDDLREFAIREGVAPSRANTVPNGIDPEVFYQKDSDAARHRFGLPLHRRIIVSAGELIEAKGHHLVIRAIKAVLERGHDVQLVIAGGVARGGPPHEHFLKRLTAELGLEDRVRFLGWVNRESLPDLLSAADLFCLASFTEGWPNVVNEALACGTPVVASAVGGVRAMLASDRYGMTVPPRELTPLVDALDLGLTRSWDRAAISAWGRSRTWATVASEVIEIQRLLVQQNRQAMPGAFPCEPTTDHVRH